MATLYTEETKNVWRTWLFMSLFFVLIVALGWVVSSVYARPAFLYVAVFFSVALNITSFWYSDKIALAINHAKPVTREENMVLWNVVENLSITAGLPMPKLYVIDDPSPNAFATGRDKQHAALAVTSGLVSMMDRVELEGVVAHELAHIGNRDILVSTVVVVLAGFVTILSDLFLRFGGFGRGRGERGNQVGTLLLVAGLVLAILSPLIATLIRLAVSRRREALADADGALLTRYPEGLARALEKIGSYGGRLKTANNATAHLFIASPFGSRKEDVEKISFLERLFMDHPPIQERIAALRGQKI